MDESPKNENVEKNDDIEGIDGPSTGIVEHPGNKLICAGAVELPFGSKGEAPLLIISDLTQVETKRKISDSDSSYCEESKKMAENIDRLINEAVEKSHEKSQRIVANRLEKVKEREKMSGKSASVNKKSAHGRSFNKYRKVPSQSQSGNTVKSLGKVKTTENTTEQTVGKREIVSSKMRNVTVQKFDIGESSSSEESSYSEHNESAKSGDLSDCEIEGNMMTSGKLFLIRNLNRPQIDDLESESTDESRSADKGEENDKKQAWGVRAFFSAEKSAAAQRRKRTSFLKKRHSDYRPSKNTGEIKNPEDKPQNNDNPGKSAPEMDETPPGVKTKKKPYERKSTKEVRTSKQQTTGGKPADTKTVEKFEAKTRKESNVKTDQNSKQPVEMVKKGNLNKTDKSDVKNPRTKFTKSVSFEKSQADKSKGVKSSSLTNEKRFKVTKCNESDDIVVFKEISLCNNDSKDLAKLNDLVLSSDISDKAANEKDTHNDSGASNSFVSNTIVSDSAASNSTISNSGYSNATLSIPTIIIQSSESEEIDWNSLVENQKAKNAQCDEGTMKPTVAQTPVKCSQAEDSSDFEAEFEACLVKFGKSKVT